MRGTRCLIIALALIGLVFIARPASAAGGTITEPGGGPGAFSVPAGTSGDPVSFQVSGTGFPAGLVYLEICDGVPSTAPNYNVNVHCDPAGGGSGVVASGPSATVNFPPSDPDTALHPFRGQSPGDLFNCLAPEDVKPGTPPMSDGSVTPAGNKTVNGDKIDSDLPSWTNCQLRLSSSNESVTGDQAYRTIALANSGVRQVPTVTVAAAKGSVGAGVPVQITATVSGKAAPPTGTVAFNDFTDNVVYALPGCGAVPIVNGTATCSSAGLRAGANKVTANYGGDKSYASAASAPVKYQATAAVGSGSGSSTKPGAKPGATKRTGNGAGGGDKTAHGKQAAGTAGQDSAASSGIGPGGIAGIVIGVVVVLALIGVGLYWLRRRRGSTAST